jgi:transposase InsO family protein
MLLHHSDRGTQYANQADQDLLTRHWIMTSMSRIGDCLDNAPVCSFFSTFKAEALPDRPWVDAQQLASASRSTAVNGSNLRGTYRSPMDSEAAIRAAVCSSTLSTTRAANPPHGVGLKT